MRVCPYPYTQLSNLALPRLSTSYSVSVENELQKLSAEKQEDDFVFGGVKDFKRSFGTLKRTAGIDGLNFHDFRHAFVSRSMLAGVPPAIVLKASGHASEEWKRYLKVTPDQLRLLLDPVGKQTAEEVKEFALSCGQSSGRRSRLFWRPFRQTAFGRLILQSWPSRKSLYIYE
jgi:hypothetical protein